MECKCTECNSNSIVKIEEPRSTSATFENSARVEHKVTRFDGCVKRNELACDFIIEKPLVGRLAVELKGSDIDHAAEQIAAGLAYLKEKGLCDLRMAGLIVCTRYPSEDTKVQRIRQRLAKQFRATLTVRRDARNIEFSSLFKL